MTRPTQAMLNDLQTRLAAAQAEVREASALHSAEKAEHDTTLQLHNEAQAELASANSFRDGLIDQLISAWMEERTRAATYKRTLATARTILARPGVVSRTDHDLVLALYDHDQPF
jgi:hypothetical protein